jgi:hypothetical protein
MFLGGFFNHGVHNIINWNRPSVVRLIGQPLGCFGLMEEFEKYFFYTTFHHHF